MKTNKEVMKSNLSEEAKSNSITKKLNINTITIKKF